MKHFGYLGFLKILRVFKRIKKKETMANLQEKRVQAGEVEKAHDVSTLRNTECKKALSVLPVSFFSPASKFSFCLCITQFLSPASKLVSFHQDTTQADTLTTGSKPEYTLPTPSLQFLFHLECDMEEFHPIGDGGHGNRATVIFKGMSFLPSPSFIPSYLVPPFVSPTSYEIKLIPSRWTFRRSSSPGHHSPRRRRLGDYSKHSLPISSNSPSGYPLQSSNS